MIKKINCSESIPSNTQDAENMGRDVNRWRYFYDNFSQHFTASDEIYDRSSLGPNATIADAIDAAILRDAS